MPDVAFTGDGLRAGGHSSGAAGRTADEASALLRAAVCPPAVAFGLVTGADVLAAALGRARDTHARVGVGVADGLAAMARRAAATAGLGDAMVAGTTMIAGSVPTARR